METSLIPCSWAAVWWIVFKKRNAAKDETAGNAWRMFAVVEFRAKSLHGASFIAVYGGLHSHLESLRIRDSGTKSSFCSQFQVRFKKYYFLKSCYRILIQKGFLQLQSADILDVRLYQEFLKYCMDWKDLKYRRYRWYFVISWSIVGIASIVSNSAAVL